MSLFGNINSMSWLEGKTGTRDVIGPLLGLITVTDFTLHVDIWDMKGILFNYHIRFNNGSGSMKYETVQR